MKPNLSFRARVWLVAAMALAGALASFVLPPLKQPAEYHRFADQRALLGVPNFGNVASNAVFLLVGVGGCCVVLARKRRAFQAGFIDPAERWPYLAFFLGVTCIAFGSSYYHWAPDNASLVWDRLPMTVAFMSLLAATIAERVGVRIGTALLLPLLAAGAGSVFYWEATGNLWPYAAVQFLSLILVGLLMWLFPARYTRGADVLWVVGLYAVAKVAEVLDAWIFGATRWISGHTVKHLLAALGICCLARMLVRRSPSPALPTPLRGEGSAGVRLDRTTTTC